MTGVQVVALQEQDEPAWDNFVRRSAHGVPQQLSGWRRVLARTYGYTTHYLMAVDGERVQGVLPLFEIRSWLTGRSLGSMPGGLCAETPFAAQALIAQAQSIARQRGIGRVLLRDARQCWDDAPRAVQHHSAFVITLQETVDAAWKQLDRRLRQHIRSAEKWGVRVDISRQPDALAVFHRTFSLFTRHMGTPVFGRNFLRRVTDIFPDRYSIACVRKGTAVIGAFFQLELGDTLYGVWGASLREHHDLYPTHLAYWELMRYSVERGLRLYDMGRSPLDSGAYEFKRHWGGQPRPIYQIIYPATDGARPSTQSIDLLGSSRALQVFTQVWRRMPLAATQLIGPRLRRHMPFA